MDGQACFVGGGMRCIGKNPTCPCQDGLACHYRDAEDGTKGWPVPKPLSPAMLRELRHIARYGEPCDLAEFHGANHLAFHARERVLSALIRRGMIADAETITDAGRAAIVGATQ